MTRIMSLWDLIDATNQQSSDLSDRLFGSGSVFYVELVITIPLSRTERFLSTVSKENRMPNLVMEYSNSVDERINVQGLLEDLHRAAIDSGLYKFGKISRAALPPLVDWG